MCLRCHPGGMRFCLTSLAIFPNIRAKDEEKAMQRILFLGKEKEQRDQLLKEWLQSDALLAAAKKLQGCMQKKQWDDLIFDADNSYQVANVAFAHALITEDQYVSMAMRQSISADLSQSPANIRAHALRDPILSLYLAEVLPTIDNVADFIAYAERHVSADQQFCFIANSQQAPNEFMRSYIRRGLGFKPLFDVLGQEAIKTIYVVPSFGMVKAYEKYRVLQNNAKKPDPNTHEGMIDVVVVEGTVTGKDVIAYRANHQHLLRLSSPLDCQTRSYQQESGQYGYFLGSCYHWSSVNLHVNIPFDTWVVQHTLAFYEERTHWPVDEPIPERHKDYHLEGLRFLLARMIKLEVAHYSQSKSEFGHSFHELVCGPTGSIAKSDHLKYYSQPLMKSCLDALLIKLIEQRDEFRERFMINPKLMLKNALRQYRYHQDHHRILNPKEGYLNFTEQVCHLLANDSPLTVNSRIWLVKQLQDLSSELLRDSEKDCSQPPLRARILMELRHHSERVGQTLKM